ncbi:sec-independent protein translocase protein TatA [Klenkia marina]|uniref:Sec-independent protein translocase protein TatA n=1 Tax=Klenkia marina TaxID=1960309 RepID=A0A1G4YMZ7_9ACTN|nr:Sec-independent protein translocase subunit TatA [Klenkia marina]SCX54851.1 sec-independent protein translocase protein TatA [Klenkia marina]
MSLGPLEIGLIILAVLLLFGYKKLPDASRSLGRSMRIFKGEMKGMKDDDVRAKDEATTVRGQLTPPATPAAPDYEAEARAAEARAAEARARADAAQRSATPLDGTR